jgi:hypothetical protein
MRHFVTGIKLVFCLALLSAGPAFTQAPSDEETSKPSAAPSPVAHVYVQTTKGVIVYDAAIDGKLTLVKGSPFATSGQMEGINGKYLISVGTDDLHIYTIQSNGAVGKQASEINTQDFVGAECGNTTELPTFLDHSGEYFYLQLSGIMSGGSVTCVAWQSYQLKSNGTLDFLGSLEYSGASGHDASPSSMPTVSSNDKFAFGIFDQFSGFSYTTFSTLERTSGGDLEVIPNFKENDPAADQNVPNGPWSYFPVAVQADPASNLAVLLVSQSFAGCCGYFGPLQLASYTISPSTGSLSSDNKWEEMPTPAITSVGAMDMSPSGKLLALAGGEYGGDGLQIFHFNGAAPITTYTPLLLPTVDIDQLAWDNDNHLYALSYSSGELYVYTAIPTSIKEVSGSPYKVETAYGIRGLIVVPKL